jgi:hypothetical protein
MTAYNQLFVPTVLNSRLKPQSFATIKDNHYQYPEAVVSIAIFSVTNLIGNVVCFTDDYFLEFI